MRKKLLRPLEPTRIDEGCLNYRYQVSAATAAKFDDPGQWAHAFNDGGIWVLNIGCYPETLDNILFDEFDRVGLDIAEYE